MFHNETHRRHSALALGLLLSWAALALFWQVKDHEFITYDDYEYVVQNPLVRSGITLSNLGRAFTTAHASNWHPLTWISHMVDSELFGMNPSAHHMSSLVLHLISTLLLFLFLMQTTRAPWKSFLVAALFALHPLHVESVAWVSERKDVLSTVFWMLTLIAYRRYALSPRPASYLLTLLLFLLGLMAKPMVVTLPFVMLLLDYWPIGRLDFKNFRISLWLEKIPFLILSAASCVLTFMVQQRWGAIVEQIPLYERTVNALHSYTVYLLKLFWPHPLAFYYPYPLGSITLLQTSASLLLLGLITGLAVRFYRTVPFLAVGWLWFLGTLVPVIGLVQVGGHGMADRYTYIPLIGLFIVLVWGTERLLKRRARLLPAFVALWACFFIALSTLTWRQVGYWKDSASLYRHATAVTQGNIVAHHNLANVLARQGALDEAERHLRTVLKFDDRYALAHNNLGNVLVKQGRVEEGIRHYETAIRIRPDFQEAMLNLQRTLSLSKDPEKQGAE